MANREDYGNTTGDSIENMPDLLLPPEVANFFRVNNAMVSKWLRDKTDKRPFPNAYKLGNKWRIPKQDVIDYSHRLYGSSKG